MSKANGKKSQVIETVINKSKGLVDLIFEVATFPGKAGKAYIEETREKAPYRRVRRNKFNSSVRYSGEGMSFAQEGESFTNEYALLVEVDFDPRVKAYWAQPKPLSLDYLNANAKRVRSMYHPDMLVELNDGRYCIVEAKQFETAKKESEEGNPRFFLPEIVSKGRVKFFDIPAQVACETLGLPHLMVTSHDVNTTLISNLLYLGKGYRSLWSPSDSTKRFVEHISSNGVCTYRGVTLNATDWTADDVNGAIATNLVYVDLKAEMLGSYSDVHIYPSKEFGDMASSMREIAAALPFSTETQSFESIDLNDYSPGAVSEAMERYAIIKPAIKKKCHISKLSKKERGWLSEYLKVSAEKEAGLLGILPKYHLRGGGKKLGDQVDELLNKAVKASASNDRLSPHVGNYGWLRLRCKEIGEPPPSKTTFYNRVRKEKAKLENIKASEGEGAAYQKSPATSFNASIISRISKRSWQEGTLDHTPLPIRLVETRFGEPISGSPRLTYLRDTNDGRVLSMHLSWRNPTQESLLAVLHDCYKQHGRLPEALMLDGERPHDATAVEEVLAAFNTDKLARRFYRPRDGNVVERGFSILEHGLLAYLQGNYVFRKNPLEWEKGWRPENFADRTIGSLWMTIRAYFFEHYNSQVRLASNAGMTPNKAAEASLRAHGERGFRIHKNAELAKIALMPFAKRGGLRTLERQTGIRVYGQCYLPGTPIDPALYGDKFLVKHDPHDIRSVMVRLRNRWHKFLHRRHELFEGLDPDQLAGVSAEIVETYRRHEQYSPERAEQTAEMLLKVGAIPLDPLDEWINQLELMAEPSAVHTEDLWNKARENSTDIPETYSEDSA